MTTELYPSFAVLLVDDEPAWLRTLAMTLEGKAGITHLLRCSDSREVLGLLGREPVGLVLLDLTMPHLSGEELLRAHHRGVPRRGGDRRQRPQPGGDGGALRAAGGLRLLRQDGRGGAAARGGAAGDPYPGAGAGESRTARALLSPRAAASRGLRRPADRQSRPAPGLPLHRVDRGQPAADPGLRRDRGPARNWWRGPSTRPAAAAGSWWRSTSPASTTPSLPTPSSVTSAAPSPAPTPPARG